MKSSNLEHSTGSGIGNWLLALASAGLCYCAWRLMGEGRDIRAETEADIRNLRDEYARLERERAALHVRSEELRTRLDAIEAGAEPLTAASSGTRRSGATTRKTATKAPNSRSSDAATGGKPHLNGSAPAPRSGHSRKNSEGADGDK